MTSEEMGDAADASENAPSPETASSLRFPIRSREDINTFAHYYRGEMSRMMSWRDRIDRTTNWAIGAVAAMLSVSLASPEAHHGVLVFAMAVTYLLLYIESRRYRFFDIYRSRVRMIERNYYAAFFDPATAAAPKDWAAELAETLRHPEFLITRQQAMARRLRRNYAWVFLILLVAWLLKTTTAELRPRTGQAEFIHSAAEFLHNAELGYVSGSVVLTGILGFYVWLLYVMARHRTAGGELTFGDAHF